jgi:hypothetical protein
MFSFFANSFLVECSQSEIAENIKFASFNNVRKSNHRMITYIYKNKVIKKHINDMALEHFNEYCKNIEAMENTGYYSLEKNINNKIESRFIDNFKSLKQVLCEKYKNNQKEDFFDLIYKFKKELEKDIINVDILKESTIFDKYNIEVEDRTMLSEFNYLKYGFWDMAFHNCYYDNDKFYFFDQEWADINVPIEFVLYRSIIGCVDGLNSNDINDIYQRIGIIKYVELFKALEEKIQNKVLDETLLKFYKKDYSSVQQIITNYYFAKKEIEEKNLTINYYLNSKVWKYTEWIRRLKGKPKT